LVAQGLVEAGQLVPSRILARKGRARWVRVVGIGVAKVDGAVCVAEVAERPLGGKSNALEVDSGNREQTTVTFANARLYQSGRRHMKRANTDH
jgi:hypothetical protein